MFFIKCFINRFPNIKLKSTITKKVKTPLNALSLKLYMDKTKFLLIYLKYAHFILVHIYNTSLSSEIFPQCLKYSVVKQIHKKGERNIISTTDQYT
jgi:hypothetical protein